MPRIVFKGQNAQQRAQHKVRVLEGIGYDRSEIKTHTQINQVTKATQYIVEYSYLG